MKRSRLVALLVSFGIVLLLAHVAPAAEPQPTRVLAWLSAPAAAPAGSTVGIKALVINPSGEERTLTCEIAATGLAVDPAAARKQVWLGPRAILVTEFTAKAKKEGPAEISLSVGGVRLDSRAVRVELPRKPTAASHVVIAGREDTTVKLPDPAGRYQIDVELTLGPAGELAATLDGLRSVSGFDTAALVARGIIPAALSKADKAARIPELELLATLQDSSGGWGAEPGAIPDSRSTSYVVFWLTQLGKAGVPVERKLLDPAVAYLRANLGKANLDMQARILFALAAAGRASDADFAAIRKADPTELSRAGQLFLNCAGAFAAPAYESREFTVLELSLEVLAATGGVNARSEKSSPPADVLRRIASKRGAEPTFNTHEAALYALALAKLAALPQAKPAASVRVACDDRRLKTIDLDAKQPVVRFSVDVTTKAGDPGVLLFTSRSEQPVICRVLIRPAE